MAADVHQRMHCAALVTDDNDGVFPQLVEEVVTGVRNFADVAGIEPALIQDFVKFFAIHARGLVEVGVQGKAGLGPLGGDALRQPFG